MDTDGDGIDDGIAPGSYADTDGIVTDPTTNLANGAGDTSEVAYREIEDKDWDGIADNFDLDADGDGILNSDETTFETMQFRPVDFGLAASSTNNTGSLDISASYGYPAGSVIVNYFNVGVTANGNAFALVAGESPRFVITGSVPVQLGVSHGSGIPTQDAQDGLISNDGHLHPDRFA